MHHRCKRVRVCVRFVRVSRRRQRRKTEKAKRHAPAAASPGSRAATVLRVATEVDQLAYTRTQAAQALGLSRTTFTRRVLPLLETIEMPWGTRLIPVDELERIVKEHRRPARGRTETAPPGRPTAVPEELVFRIQAEHARGKSMRQIARDLNASKTPTAHGGVQWWPSTVRAVLRRSAG
jgi:Recombinase